MSFWSDALAAVIESGKRAAAKSAQSMAEDAQEGLEALQSDLSERSEKPQRIKVAVTKKD